MLSRRGLVLGAVALLCASLVALTLDTTPDLDAPFGQTDFVQYWSGIRLLITGANPYDPFLMAQAQRQVSSFEETVLMWNPPLVFLPLLPFVAPPFAVAAQLWILVGVTLFVLSYAVLRSSTPARARLQLLAALTLLYPLAVSLYFGQLSPLLLVGLALYLAFHHAPQGVRQFAGGAALALTMLKPYLLYLPYLVFARRGLTLPGDARRWVLGFVATLVVLIVAPLVTAPQVYSWYLEAMRSPPIYWQTPTIGSWLQGWSGIHTPWMRMLPTVITLLALAPRLLAARSSPAFTYVLIPLSLLTAPYGWLFDFVLLLPVAMWLASDEQYPAQYLTVMAIAGVIVAAPIGPNGLQYTVWFPALYLMLAWHRYCNLRGHDRESGAIDGGGAAEGTPARAKLRA